MKLEYFELERILSIWENEVEWNLSESGVHPYTLNELLSKEEIDNLLSIRLGYGQTNGSIELRNAISQLYHNIDLDNILVTNGSAEANFIAIWCILEPGDELIYMLPNYMQIWGLAQSFGVVVKSFHLREEFNWGPDIEEIRNLISSKTKMIAVCNPNNPTGSVLNEDTMKDIIHLAKEGDFWVYSDEVYQGASLNDDETPSLQGFYDKTLITGGLSKAYALPGLRIGWLVGPKEIIAKAWAYHDYTTISSNILSNHIATAVLQKKRKHVLDRNRSILKENLAILKEWVLKHSDIFKLVSPQAGGIAFIKYNMNINSTEFTTKLREEKSVLIVPGDCFGMDNYIRIGFATDKGYLVKSLDVIDDFLEEYFQ